LEPEQVVERLHREVAYANVLDDPAAVKISLKTNGGRPFTQHIISKINVPDSAAHLAAERDAVLAAHVVVTDDDVLTRAPNLAPVPISSRFHYHRIVAGAEEAALDQHIAARIHVHPVVIGIATVHANAPDRGVVGIDEMIHPERRIEHRVILKQHTLGAEELDNARAQVRARAEDTLVRRRASHLRPFGVSAGSPAPLWESR